jgi:hypothetical protein
MITLNNKQFAETENEMITSLFNTGGTCVGYATRNRKSITLKNMQKEKVGVINAEGVLARADKLDNGKYWYSYGDIDIIGKYQSYTQEVKECKQALELINPTN